MLKIKSKSNLFFNKHSEINKDLILIFQPKKCNFKKDIQMKKTKHGSKKFNDIIVRIQKISQTSVNLMISYICADKYLILCKKQKKIQKIKQTIKG